MAALPIHAVYRVDRKDGGRFTEDTEDAEQIGAILADKMPPPTMVVMNPPSAVLASGWATR